MTRRGKVASAFSRALLASLIAASAAAADTVEYAKIAPLASRSLLLDIAWAGPRLVAVGERGHILHSDDRGRTWKQAERVPTRALLTAVCFLDARQGIAVGHDQVILTTNDAGLTWRRAHYAPEARQPLLDVWCGAGGKAIAVGAYAGYFTSLDKGASWRERRFAPVKDGADYHLNRIVGAPGSRLYIAAEAGHLYASDDIGETWTELASPYEGSFFGVLPLTEDSLLAYGLRGRLFRSDDAGRTWRKVETGTVAMLSDAARLPEGGVAIVGLSGVVLIGGDEGRHFATRQQDDRKGLSAVLPVAPGEWAVAGEAGVKIIGSPP